MSSVSASANTTGDHLSHRLPKTATPHEYKLTFTPDMKAFTFKGHAIIAVAIHQTSKTLKLNAIELQIDSANVDGNSATVTYDTGDETATLTFEDDLSADSLIALDLSFRGTLNDQMRGFYRSSYVNANGEADHMCVTQFEATDARRCFPCWDEPAYKAHFSVELIVPEDQTALSNMPVVHSEPITDNNVRLLKHRFDKSPLMSSYLLTMAVGQFDYIEEVSDGVTIRVYTPPGDSQKGKFALSCAARVLPFYNKWFGIRYTLPKLDMIAIPDFAAGAMEGWGLVTYRTTAVLFDEKNSSAHTKQNIALTVTHEIAHQWFGNLTTMEWWRDLWLNEGFATWMESYATDHLFPEWNIWSQFVYSDVNSALSLDSLLSSHPVEVDVLRAEEVDEIFDAVSYSKGSVVIRILQDWLGFEAFQRGIIAYIKRYSHKNATTLDLWTVLEEVTGKPVKNLMECWTQHVGFPVLTLSEPKPHATKANTLTFEVSQQRFLIDGNSGKSAEPSYVWQVPIAFLISGTKEPVGKQILSEANGTLTLELPASTSGRPSFIKLNPGHIGLYRVIYPPPLFDSLRAAIEKSDPTLSAADRLGIAGDAFALCRAGLISSKPLLSLVAAYKNETDYTVWADLLGNLADFSNIMIGSSIYDRFHKFAADLLNAIVAHVGWESQTTDNHTTSLLRARVIGAAVKYGHKKVRAEAKQKFEDFYKHTTEASAASDKHGVSADIRSAVYNAAVNEGGEATYKQMKHLFEVSTLQEEKVRCAAALAATADKSLLSQTVTFALNSMRSQDIPSIIQAVAANRNGGPIVWDFIQNDWTTIDKRFGGTSGLPRIISALDHLSSNDSANDIAAFFSKHTAVGAERSVEQTVETIRSNAKWLQAEQQNVEEWLTEHSY